MRSKTCILLSLMVFLLFAGVFSQDVHAEEQLVVSGWGFGEDLLWEHIFTPFEEKYGVKIIYESGTTADRLQRVIMRGGTEVDVIWLSESYALQGIERDLFAEIDRSKIPNIEQIYDVAKAPHGEKYGPAYTLTSFAIMYDENAVDAPVTSWAEFWDERFENNLSIPVFDTTSGPAILFEAADLAGVNIKEDLDAVFQKMSELKPNIVKTYPQSAHLINMFAQGEVIIGAVQSFASGRISAAVEGATWVYPTEGGYINLNTVNITKNSNQKDLAHKFINFILSKEIQQNVAEAGLDSPVNMGVELTFEKAEELGIVYGMEIIESLKTIDWEWVNENKQELNRRWDREVAN